MSAGNLTPQEAYEAILKRLDNRVPELASRIRDAVQEGKQVYEQFPSNSSKQKTQKSRTVRQKVPYTYEEAVGIALEILKAHFVELPLVINSAHDNFAAVARATPLTGRTLFGMSGDPEKVKLEDAGEPKIIEVELVTATAIVATDRETVPLERVSDELLTQQRHNFERLSELLDFN
ncbi:MAG TPA: hypothetical protein VGB77_15320 [Abditibacteriaceae bacterium]|jgi:predicted exporter